MHYYLHIKSFDNNTDLPTDKSAPIHILISLNNLNYIDNDPCQYKMQSIGYIISHNWYIGSLIYAPMFMSKTKGFIGTLESAISEAIIISFIMEICYIIHIIYNNQPQTKLLKILNIIKCGLLFLIASYEANIFIPKAEKHWIKYAELNHDIPQNIAVTCLTQSIGAISIMIMMIRFFLQRIRFE